MAFSPRGKDPAPLYITVGPPCSGKTTWLRTQEEGRMRDVSLDDQPDTYIPLDLEYFVDANTTGCLDRMRKESILGTTLADRVQSDDQRELRSVLQRLSGRTSASEFAKEVYQNMASPTESAVQKILIDSVEGILNATDVVQLSPTIDLFIRERIFRSDERYPTTGIESATQLLYDCATDVPISWGNTNTRPTDYKIALEMAAATRRPVRFVLYGDLDELQLPNPEGKSPMDFLTPDLLVLQASLPELVRRNVQRLVRTGRYVPVGVIRDMQSRSSDMIREVVHAWRGNTVMKSVDVDRSLARLAQFDLLPNGTVVALPQQWHRRTFDVPRQQAPPIQTQRNGYHYDARRRPGSTASGGAEGNNVFRDRSIRRPNQPNEWRNEPPFRRGGYVHDFRHAPERRPPGPQGTVPTRMPRPSDEEDRASNSNKRARPGK
jgi:hypothetical protein